MMLGIALLAILGFLLSLYAYQVEQKLKRDPSYKPACDISDMVSCTKPLTSKYGNIFFVSNSILGMLYYAAVFFLALFDSVTPLFHIVLFYMVLVSVIISIVLLYILLVKIKSFCLICSSVHIINFLIFILLALALV